MRTFNSQFVCRKIVSVLIDVTLTDFWGQLANICGPMDQYFVVMVQGQLENSFLYTFYAVNCQKT